MKYYKYLDIDCSTVSHKLAQYVYDNSALILSNKKNSAWNPVNKEDVLAKVPELGELFKPLNITIKYLAFFITEKQDNTIHTDGDTESNLRINIPVLNCEKSETRFFTITEEPVMVKQGNGILVLMINPLACTQVDKFELTRPVMLRVNQPHQVVSFNEVQPRISCSIGFYEDLEFLFNQ
jgi:hypothetical protein